MLPCNKDVNMLLLKLKLVKRFGRKVVQKVISGSEDIHRDRIYIRVFTEDGVELTVKQEARLKIINMVYEQAAWHYVNT